jgi:hypothetical protein
MEDVAVQLAEILNEVNNFLQSDFRQGPPCKEPRVHHPYMRARARVIYFLFITNEKFFAQTKQQQQKQNPLN